MKYIRQFTRKQERNHTKTLEQQKYDLDLARKVLTAVTAFSFIGNPFAAMASTVTRVDGTKVDFQNNVGNIYAEKIVNNNTAVNRFQDFKIDAGDIANMYFKTDANSKDLANNLVNFVNSSIDVAGTVNAIKDSKIGGNLFFLSSSGMAVTGSGVINAGSLYVMTPTESYMKGILGDDLKGFDAEAFNTQWKNISTMQVPVNANGTITVEGKIHTTNGIGMKAAHIRVGKEDTASDSNAWLKTGIVDFSGLVNIKNDDGTVTDAGLGKTLTATKTGSGDIVLAAVATERNEKDTDFDESTTDNNLVHASITMNGTIDAAGDADITATASSGEAYEKYFNDEGGETADELDVWGQIVKTKADIAINGDVTAQHVNVAAESRNSFITSGVADTPLSTINAVAGAFTLNMDAAYAVLGGEASVDIGEDAVLTAKASEIAATEDTPEKKSINITADSRVKAAAGSSTTAIKVMNFKHSGNIPSVAAAYANTENKANVRIAGTIKAAGDTNISANADTHLEAVSTDNTTYVGGNENDKTRVNSAITIANGKNASTVEIADTAKMTEISGDLDISAVGTNSIDTEALVKGKEEAAAATAINVTNYESSADVKVNASLKADSVSVTAGNLVTNNTVTADNSIGTGMLMTGATSTVLGSQTMGTIKEKVQEIKKKFSNPEDTVGTFVDKLGDMISVGASVAVADESNAAHVSIGKDVQITAQDAEGKKGDITVRANNIVKDTQMKALGTTNNHTDENNPNLLVSAAVLDATVNNEAGVTIEGGEAADGKHAVLSGANVTIEANSKFRYGRIDKMIGELLRLCEKLKGAYGSNSEYAAKIDDLAKKAQTYKENAEKDPNWADSQERNDAMLALAAAAQGVSSDSVTAQIKDIFVGPLTVAGAAAAFANPANYANFQASSNNSGKGDASLGLAGAVNINRVGNNASVRIGREAEISASGKVDVNAVVAQKDVAISGKIGLNGGAETAVGGTVGIHFGETNSLIAVAEGAEITGAAVNVAADNDVMHTNIAIGAGKGGSNGLSGMASYMEGTSSSVVSIDDEAALTANGTGTTEGTDDGGVRIDAGNTTVITNIAGGGALGQTSGIGASVAITDYTVDNIAAIADNDADASAGEDETKKRLLELVRKGLKKEEQAALFGSAANNAAGGGITARLLDVSSLNDSVINTVTIAGAAVTGDDSDEPGIADKIGTFFNNNANKVVNKFNQLDTAINNKLTHALDDPNILPTDMKPTKGNMGAKLPSLSIAGAGSASVNLVEGKTASLVDGAQVNLSGDSTALQVGAEDDSFIGAWGGAAAITWKQSVTDQNWNNKNIGLAGAVAVNLTDTAAISRISGTTIEGADAIVNTAKKGGALVAAGLGLSAAKAGQGGGQSYNGAASVSVNDSKNTIEAVMENNTVNQENGSSVKTELTNSAYDNDTQVTGGINASLVVGGDKGVAIGGTVGYSSLTNTVTSAIRGGTYNDMGTVDVSALTDITQVGVAAGVSATTTSGGQSIGFNGVAAYNSLTNTVTAGIEDADVMAETVGVRAQDMDLGEKKYDTYISDRGLDATGQSYINNVKDTADDLEDPGKTGNTIVTGALGISAATDSKGGAGAAAISISDINNDFDAHITGGKVTASGTESGADVADVDVYAKSDTLLVGVAAGGAGTNGNITGVGSLTWQTIDNDTTASIEKAEIHADATSVRALTGSLGVNVAGQISAGKNAVGLALAYNNIENTTGAYVKGGSIDRYENEDGTAEGSASVTVEGKNNSKLYAVGAGVGVSTDKLAANGTIAINIGRNNTEAVIDAASDGTRAKLDHISSLSVTTDDQSRELAVAGGVGGSKTVAVGGAVAYNEIGNISGKGDEKKQQNTAQVNHADITTEDGAAIEVGAKDNSSLTTAAVGVGITAGGLAAVQGSAATALINKNTEASMDGTVISSASKAETGEAASAADAGADVDVNAESHNSILTTANVLAANAGGTGAAVGAGVAVNRSEADVKAAVTGGTMHVKDLRVDALNQANIETIGVGGSVQAGTGAGVTGSVAVNQIGNTTTAVIAGGADIAASNNVIVAASSDESIANYAGSISVAVQGAAVGLSVSVNEITSGTHASVEGDDTKVSAEGKGDKEKVKDSVGDDKILDGFVDKDAFDGTASLADERKDSEYSGVAVSASSTHTIKSFLVNGGAAGEGAAVNGTVNVNMIGGSTSAAIRGADINTNAASAGDVHVTAHDYANSAGIVGTVNGTGIGAAVGLGSDTNTVSREVSAEILGKGAADDNGRYASKNTVNADTLSVDAEAKQGISSLTTGISVGGIGAGVSNATSVALLEGKTAARINGTAVSAASLDVTADHAAKMNTLGVAVGAGGAGAGVGIGVSVLNENSETSAEATDAEIAMTGADGEVTIKANNHTKVNYQLYNGGGAVVGAAGSIGVSNVNSKVNTSVENTSVGQKITYTEEVKDDDGNPVMVDGKPVTVEKEKIEGAAKDITIGAENHIDFTNKSGTGSAGAVGIGVGVAVNTIDSQVQTHVGNAKIYATGNIGVSANETRNVDQLAVNASAGGAAGGANIMITNVGKAVDSVYGSNLKTDDGGKVQEGGVDQEDGVNIDNVYTEANKAVSGNQLKDDYLLGIKGTNAAEETSVTLGKGGTQESMVKVTVNGGSMLDASGRVDLDAVETTNVKMDGINASLGMTGSVSGTVGVLGVHRNSGVEVTFSSIRAAEFGAQAAVNGKSDLDIYQGTVGGNASIGAAYGSISTDGKTGVGISDSTVETTGSVSVSAEDTSQADVDAIGVALAGGGAASVIVAEGTNRGETTVTVDKTDITAGKDISVDAKRKAEGDSLHVRAIAGSGGLIFAGAGVSATANEFGTVGIAIDSHNTLAAGQQLNITALNAPSVYAEAKADSASMLISGAITAAKTNIGSEGNELETYVTVGEQNTFVAGSSNETTDEDDMNGIHITAEADATQTVVMEGLSISASLFPLSGAIQANVGGADVFSTVSVDVADNTTYKGSDDTTVDVDIAGNNNVSQTVTAQGFSASTFAASGTNAAESNVNLETTVNVKGSSSESNIHDLAVRGDSNADVTVTAKGDGGGLVGLSPDAASVDHTYTADTNVALSGLWNTEGAVEATAINGGEINLTSDALQAAVVGASGVWLHNKVANTANVKLDNAEITTGGRQSYLAQNIADYDGDIKGSGYGGVSITGTELTDDFDFAANVEIKDSMLHGEGDEGSITAQALTTGDISSRNELKSAGVIPVSVAGSEHKFVYNNAVDVNGSELITDKKNQNVTLASSDNTTVDLNTTADTQGGVIGAASAEATISEFTRTNDVHIEGDSYIESANDVNLYAGVDANGKYASLNLNLIADAYNRTALPLATAPSVSNTNMSQNNTVTIEDDVASVRHINAKAVKGNTTIAKSAREYKNIGSGGSGSLTTTAGGHEEGSDESWNNKVVINGGTLTAGIHNQLDITISGETTTNVVYKDPDKGIVDEDKSGVDYSNISLDIGQEWFKQEDIRPTETIIVNNLKADYLKLADAIMDYPVESEEYKNLKAAMEALEQQMEELGFLSPDLNPNGNSTIVKEPMDTKTVLGIELPDIVVSGGNINIETDSVTGNSGAITAQGSPQINITNDSDLYLKVNDITIQSNGGQVTLNGTAMTADSAGNEFKGSVMPSNVEANDSSINITSTSKPKTEFVNNKLAQADIGVYGDITNAVGDINIKNTNYDITIADGAQLSAVNITLVSEHGSVTRTSTSGIINVGGDPVSQYQFGQEVAEKIQKYVNDQLRKAHEKGEEWEGESFATRDEYITWLKEVVGVTDDELGDTELNEKAGIVAGNNVYIKGVDVNINGLVQAGYGNYSAELGSDAVNAIRDLDNKYSGKNFTDSEVMGNDKFLVNTGGQQWNDVDKVWDYEVKIYYNPTTKKLLVDNVNPNGGQIYIEGNISNTGNGRLMAMDGMADINIDTTYIRNDDTVTIDSIVVNSIANKDIEGLITITDMNKTFTDSEGQKVQGLVTEYKNGQVREYGAGTSFADRELIAWKDNSDYDYEPEAGLQYQYTGGYKSGEVNHKSYTKDFLFWTGLKYDKTTTIEEAVEKDGGTPEVVTTSNPEGAPTGQGAFISKNENSTGGWSISGSYTEGKESDPSPVVTETHWGPPEWLGYIGGYGQIEYKWTTENATTSSSTSSINASNTIKIGFLGNGSNEGHINIKGNQNIELAGNISNAAINRGDGDVGAGHVSITSNEGSIISNSNAYINSDDVILKAGTGINVNHAAIGSSAAVDATTASGDIRFVSAGGDLHIKQAITGGSKEIDAETGNVYLEADGSILNASTGAYAVKGQRIDLISKAGSIGTAETALTVLGGSKLYSSDTMASSVNASAKGDVVLTQTSGDMRLGTIISEEGDAVLTVNDGSFVDAYSDSSSGYSDTADKIQQWIDMGLIKEEADDNNSTQAGDDARAERLKGLEMQKWALANGDEAAAKEYDQAIAEYKEAISEGGALHEARQNYLQAMQKEDGDSAAAYETYMAAVDAYFENTSFGDNEAAKNLISSYAEVDSSNNYGWSKNQLLYAIQESILNSEPGQVATVDYANVTANNITLIAEQGGVGIDAADTKITADQLSNIDNLKVLAASKGGDLTWHEDGSVTVRQQQAINLKVNKADGTTTVKGKENVYLAGTEGTTLNVSDIQTENDIKLMTDNGVFMTGDDGILSGKNLTIYGGNGSVGTADRYITTAISGMLDANSLDSVYIRQQEGAGNLTIQSVAVGNDVFLNAADGIVMTTESGKTAGYINAGDEINLVSNGTIGKEGDGIRINNNGAVVHAEGADIYLSGKGAEDTLVLGKIASEGAVIVDSEGSVSIGRDAGTITLDKGQGSIAGEESEAEPETITVEAVTGQIDSEGNISITAEENIALRDGAINSVGETGHAELTATGTITQDENAGGIHVQDLTVKSDGMQALISQNNVVNSVSIDGRTGHTIAGDAAFVTNSPDGLNAVLHDITAEDGSVIIANLGGGVHVSGSVTTTKNEGFEGDTDILMTSQGTLISEDKLVSAGKVHMDAADGITVQEDLYANKDVVMNTNTGNILFDGKESGQTDEIHITSVSGNVHVSLDEGGTGHIKDTHRDDGGNKAILTAEVGNVVVENNGIGDVDLYEVLAENEARVSVADGDLHLVNVSGDLVAILVKTPGKTMDVQHVEAATEIQISGSNMDLDSIKQREDGDGFLVITPEGTAEDRPIDNLVIGDILTNGGVRFDHLWLNTGDIHVSEGAFHLDKVYVQDKATFSTDDMTTNVFGSAPVYDDSVSSSYWVNTGINSPKDDLAAWNSDELNDKWMHIFFAPEGTVQISNGNLLHLADHNYAYNQRYSQVDWMNLFTDEDFYNFYDKYYAPELSYHERYGLTSGDGHSVENAEEDELIVE